MSQTALVFVVRLIDENRTETKKMDQRFRSVEKRFLFALLFQVVFQRFEIPFDLDHFAVHRRVTRTTVNDVTLHLTNRFVQPVKTRFGDDKSRSLLVARILNDQV